MAEDQEAEKLKDNSVPDKPVDNSTKTVDKPKPKKAAQKGKNGGARPGAGRPKGGMNKASIEKMAVKKEFELRVARHAHALFNTQVQVALGAQYLFKRYKIKTGKGFMWSRFEIVSDPKEIAKYLDGDFKGNKTEYYVLMTKAPDMRAADSLLDRGFGKAPQNLNIKDDRPDPIAAILHKFGLLEEEGNSDAGEDQSAAETSP